MAQQNHESTAGYGTLLALLALGFVLAYWKLFLAVGLVGLCIIGLAYVVLRQNQQQLRALVSTAERRVRNDPCQVRGQFGVIESLTLAGDLQYPRIDVWCQTIGSRHDHLVADAIRISLSPPAERLQLRSTGGAASWLRAGGITRLEDLSVEARAVRAAMDCLREREWTGGALDQLDELRGSVIATLAKAEGNELLEAAIPQLQQALTAFNAERDKLQAANHSAGEMLRKLHDFLSVPDGIRPILNFDLDQVFDPQRLSALEQSFAEVVLLNDTFRELSRDALG